MDASAELVNACVNAVSAAAIAYASWQLKTLRRDLEEFIGTLIERRKLDKRI